MTVDIKDHEVARLASMLQAEYGNQLAELWNRKAEDRGIDPIYDSGDSRIGFVHVIKQWRTEMYRDPNADRRT